MALTCRCKYAFIECRLISPTIRYWLTTVALNPAKTKRTILSRGMHYICYNHLPWHWPIMSQSHHAPVPFWHCTRPILSVPLRTSPILSQSHYVPGKLCSSPIVYQAHCVPGPLCQAHCVPGPLCHRPTVSQAHCVPGPGRKDLVFETAVSRVTC